MQYRVKISPYNTNKQNYLNIIININADRDCEHSTSEDYATTYKIFDGI